MELLSPAALSELAHPKENQTFQVCFSRQCPRPWGWGWGWACMSPVSSSLGSSPARGAACGIREPGRQPRPLALTCRSSWSGLARKRARGAPGLAGRSGDGGGGQGAGGQGAGGQRGGRGERRTRVLRRRGGAGAGAGRASGSVRVFPGRSPASSAPPRSKPPADNAPASRGSPLVS